MPIVDYRLYYLSARQEKNLAAAQSAALIGKELAHPEANELHLLTEALLQEVDDWDHEEDEDTWYRY